MVSGYMVIAAVFVLKMHDYCGLVLYVQLVWGDCESVIS